MTIEMFRWIRTHYVVPYECRPTCKGGLNVVYIGPNCGLLTYLLTQASLCGYLHADSDKHAGFQASVSPTPNDPRTQNNSNKTSCSNEADFNVFLDIKLKVLCISDKN